MSDDEIDEDNPAFIKYLEKNLPWLQEKLKPSVSSQDPPKGFDPLAFLTKERETLSEWKDRVMSILTPEQLASLRASAGSQKEADGQKLDEPPTKPDKPAEKPKKKWL